MLTHSKAHQLVNAAIRELTKRNKAAAVAVADSHGELLAFLRMDGVKLSSITIALNKAYTAARSQKPTSEVGRATKDPDSGFDISYYGDPRYTGFGGGIPVKENNHLIGAVAISGLSQEEDEEIARIAVYEVLGAGH